MITIDDKILQKMKEINPWCFSSQRKVPVGIDGYSSNVLKQSTTPYQKIKEEQPSTTFQNVGVILTNRLCCIDIDYCLSEDGSYKPEAEDIIEHFKDCYIERSVSGEGVHIFFYLTQKQYRLLQVNQPAVKCVFQSKVKDGHAYQAEFYFKDRTRVMIVTEDEIFKSETQHRIWVPDKILFYFINQYMDKKDKTASGKDFGELIPYIIQTNGDKEKALQMFQQEKEKNECIREGRFPDKWTSKTEHKNYMACSLQKAEKRIKSNLRESRIGFQKSRTNKKLLFGNGFFKELRRDNKAFNRDDNVLCSFLFLLWEANTQFFKAKPSQHYPDRNGPTIMIDLEDIENAMNCNGFNKAIRVLDKLQELGYLGWKGTDAILITFFKYYPMNENGSFVAHEKYIALPEEIFADYFITQKQKCEKTDLLLYLYNVSERCDPGELNKQIASFFTACFGFYYDGANEPIKRYDVPQKELAKFLNVSESTLSVQLKKLMELHYIYKSYVGNKYDQAIVITLCDFTYWSFKKYKEGSGEELHKSKHGILKECIKIRKGNHVFSQTMTILNFLDKMDENYSLHEEEQIKTA